MKRPGGTPYLMYHELAIPGRRLAEPGDQYARFAVTPETLAAQLGRLREDGLRGWSVGEALDERGDRERGVVITFDDGSETDLTAAAPLLAEAGFGATFFVVSGWIGSRGRLSAQQLRELNAAGFEIGTHSRTHLPLGSLSPERLRTEIVRGRDELEQLIGSAVHHLSCPFGSWSPIVARVARESGMSSVCTSRIVVNLPRADPFRLGRLVVMRETSPAAFARLIQGEGLGFLRLRRRAGMTARIIVGPARYEELRASGILRSARSRGRSAPPSDAPSAAGGSGDRPRA